VTLSFDPPSASRSAAHESEAAWQSRWRASGIFRTRHPERPKWYVLELPPFATGSLHLGHARNYVLADAAARFRRMCGHDVLYTTGYDTFGLPSELAAREAGVHPAELVEACCAKMGRQLSALGLSHDQARITGYHEPRFYRWVQWVFLRLWEAGHCIRREAPVLWCPACDASLTESLAERGRCWRCDTPVERRTCQQWFVTETHFADALLDGLEQLDGWPTSTRRIHADWIGRRQGWRTDLPVDGRPGASLPVFLENEDDLEAAVAVGLAADHPLFTEGRVRLRVAENLSVPVIAVPEHLLPTGEMGLALSPEKNATCDRLLAEAGIGARAHRATSAPRPTPATIYRLKDWCITRQRYWGPPVPIIHCPDCGPRPAPDEALPVELPMDVDLAAYGNPLAAHDRFVNVPCPSCGQAAKRDTDTFEAYSSPWWYHWLPMEDGDGSPFDRARDGRWLPVDLMIGGSDQVRSCFFHVRMIAKALKALGLSDVDEPVRTLLPIGMVQSEGAKMSKSAGNAIDLEDLLFRHGADAVRFAVLSGAAPERDFNWSPSLVQRAEGFLGAVRRFGAHAALQNTPSAVDAASASRAKLAGWVATGVHKVTLNLTRNEFHLFAQNLEFLLDRLQAFERASGGAAAAEDAAALRLAWRTFVRILAPAAPHLAEELWARLGEKPFVATANWPTSAGPVATDPKSMRTAGAY